MVKLPRAHSRHLTAFTIAAAAAAAPRWPPLESYYSLRVKFLAVSGLLCAIFLFLFVGSEQPIQRIILRTNFKFIHLVFIFTHLSLPLDAIWVPFSANAQRKKGKFQSTALYLRQLVVAARGERSFLAPLLVKPCSSMGWREDVEEPRVLIAPDPGTSGNGLGRLLLLRHPKSGNASRYLFVNGMLQELQWFKKSHGSWFLGDYLCEDGRLYLSTPVDPVFIMLPIFDEARMKKGDDPGKFRQLDEILFVDGYPEYQHLMSTVENCMQVVCEVKEVGSTKFFRLDDSKVQHWLYCKVCQLKQTLPKLDKNFAVQEEKDTLVDAVSILGEYLKDEPWLQFLCNHLKLDILEVTGKAQVSDAATRSDPGFVNVSEEKSEDKKAAKKGRQTKKAKMETESHNIKDMFTRASRKKN